VRDACSVAGLPRHSDPRLERRGQLLSRELADQRVQGRGKQVRSSKVTPLLAARRDLAQLERRFQTARESYEGLRDACEARIARWQWSNGDLYDLDPLFFLDPGIRVGQISPLPPQNPAEWTAYGFSREGQLVAERQYTELPDRQYYHGFYFEEADRIIGYRFHYSSSRAVINCSQFVVDNSRPSYFQRWGSRGWVSYTYACSDHRVDPFVGLAREHDEPERQFSGQVLYRDQGIVELWKKRQGQRAELFFRGRPPIDNPFLRARGT
jgi:hypothetical protein